MATQSSQIVDFFTNKTIFLTGATGFIGKLLIDKLLRVCRVRKIYLLVREKRGKNEEQRFQDLFDCPIYEPLKNECPNYRTRVQLVIGDCELENLGISSVNWGRLQAEAQIVIHCAATIRFDQSLRIAYNINIRATKDLIKMCEGMKNLQAFIHVSTAYTNCVRKDIEEKAYPATLDDVELELILNSIKDDDTIATLTPGLIGKWPNTYSFTKCIAENMITKMAKVRRLPIAVFRPSIVISTYKEPIPGWIDNYNGPIGALFAIHLGLIRTANSPLKNFIDVLPADYVINAILAIAWQTSVKKPKEVIYYNYVMGKHAINNEKYFGDVVRYVYNLPDDQKLWYLTFSFNPENWKYKTYKFLLHIVPAYTSDVLLKVMGKKPIAVTTFNKMQKFMNVICYFMQREWDFGTSNTKALWHHFNEEDKKLFELRVEKFNWDDFRIDCFRGAFKYLFKLPERNPTEANKRYRRLLTIHWTLMAILILVFLYFLYRAFSLFCFAK